MRISHGGMVANSLSRLHTRVAGYGRAHTELATGRRLRAPSDDPAGANRTLALRADQCAVAQQDRNAADAASRLALADSKLQDVVARLHRARDLVVRGSTDVDDHESRALAAEVAAIRDELAGMANARHRGLPLFGGFAAVEPVARDDGGVWSYRGDDGAITRRVGAQDSVRVNVTAAELLGFDPGRPAADLLSVLDGIEARLLAGEGAALTGSLTDLDRALDRVGEQLARVGTAARQVESAQRRNADRLLAVRGELSEVEDADLAATIVELQLQQVAFEATLASVRQALPASLLSFLR